MSATARMPLRSKILQGSFVLYAILSLISMATMSIGAAILITAILLTSPNLKSLKASFQTEWKINAFRKYFWLSLILSIACAASLIGGIFFPLSYGGKSAEVHFLKDMAKAWYLFWPCLMVVGLRRLEEKDREVVFRAWIGFFALLSALGISQYFFGWPREQSIPGESGHYHVTLFLGHHLSVASIFIFPFFASLDFGYRNGKSRSWIFYGAAFLGFATLFLTYSRTLWVALPFGVFLWAAWSAPKKWRFPAILSIILGTFALTQYAPIKRRLLDGIGFIDRKELWLANLEFFKQRPLTGVGWHHNQDLSAYYLMNKFRYWDVFNGHAHNNLLDMLGGLGLFGALAWLAWCGWVFWISLPQKLEKKGIRFSHGLICAWIVFHINGLTQVNFWEGKVQHQMAWVIAWALLWYR